jgi:hypothetical protein
MTFMPGQSGNPAGRPVGALGKKTLALEASFAAQADALVDGVIKRAQAGHPAAMRLCMERAMPIGRGRPLPIKLPVVKTAADAEAAVAEIMAALGEGAITVRETADLLRVVEGLTRTVVSIAFIKTFARKEVAKVAAQLGMEHFFAGPPAPPANTWPGESAETDESL